MSMRAIIIAWIVAIATVVASRTAWRSAGTRIDAVEAASRVHAVAIPVDEVDRVVVERADADGGDVLRYVFERGPAGWRQIEPFEVSAEGFAVRRLVVAAADLAATRRTPVAELSNDDGGLGRLGLDPADARIELAWPGGSTAIDLGARTVAGRAWIRVSGNDDLLVVGDGLHERAVDDDPRNWRSRRLFPSETEVVAIGIMNGPVTTTLERDGRRWAMRSPIETRADPEAIDRLVAVVGRVEHDGFVVDDPQDLGRFGLAEPAATLAVTRDDGTVERLLVGGPSGLVSRDRFAMIEGVPTVVRLDEATLRGLLPAVTGLIEPTGTGVRPADVRSIVIDGDAGSVRLERDLDRWTAALVAGERTLEGDADPVVVTQLLDLLSGTRATELLVQDFPTQLQVATIVLHGFDGRPIDAVRVARESNAGRWAIENGDGVLRLFPASTKLAVTPDDFPVIPVGP